MSRLIDQIDNDLGKKLGRIIHDWNNLHYIFRIYAENEDNPEYHKDLDWTKQSKNHWNDGGEKFHKLMKEFENYLYEKEEG